MAKQPKPKTTKGGTNDDRRSKKAYKQNPGRKHRGEKLSEGQLVLMGKGTYVKFVNSLKTENVTKRNRAVR